MFAGFCISDELISSLREMEHRVLQIMGNDRTQQMIDNITLYNTLLEEEMEKDM